MNANTNNNTNDDIFRIDVENPLTFREVTAGDIKLLSTLSTQISNYFYYAYKDFAGCIIKVDSSSPNQFNVRLVFQNAPSEATNQSRTAYAFELAEHKDPRSDSIRDKLDRINSRMHRPRIFSITKFGKEGLAKYIPGTTPETCNSFNWNSIIGEIPQVDMYGRMNQMVYVDGLDINLITKDLYPKFKGDGRLIYTVRPIRPFGNPPQQVDPTLAAQSTDWIIDITRINESELSAVGAEVGLTTVAYNGVPGMVSPAL